MNPIDKFKEWYAEEILISTDRIPSACCLSSIGIDGYPNSRFVSLKEVLDNKFVITGPLHSKKGIELLNNPKAALAFWWTKTERQIRIQGKAVQIEDDLADTYFSNRNKDSQIVSMISQQGHEIGDIETLKSLFEKAKLDYKDLNVSRPKDWSGFYIIPKRIEFLEFKSSRLHLRELYEQTGKSWTKIALQP